MKPQAFLATIMALLLSWASASADTIHYTCEGCISASIVTGAKEKRQATAGLRQAFMASIGAGQVTTCSLVIQETWGQERLGKPYSSFGGSCDVIFARKTTQWMICYDNAVGHFAAITGDNEGQDENQFLAHFIDTNCVGG